MKNIKTEGGQGGKKGHTQMDHWDYTIDFLSTDGLIETT